MRAGELPATLPSDEAQKVEDLTQTSLGWLVLVSLVGRIGLTVAAAGLTRGLLGSGADAVLLVAVVVVAVDGLLIVAALRRPRLLRTPWLFGLDLGLTCAATGAATLAIAPGLFLLGGRDAMTGYGWGTVALWTAIRGWRTGACLVGAMVALQLSMARLNHAVFDARGVASLFQRGGIALIDFAIATAVVALARHGARRTVAEGMRTGRLAQRAEALRALHDTALAELDAVALIARPGPRPAEERLTSITRRAARQAVLTEVGGSAGAGSTLTGQLTELAEGFRERGLRVQMTGGALSGTLADRPPAGDALVGAVREALNNVVKHAGVEATTVSVSASENEVLVEVRDDGRGFAPDREARGFGLSGSVRQRMREAGGSAVVVSSPGHGTTVRLTAPVRAATPVVASPQAPPWFPLVPVVSRILCLPIIASMVGDSVGVGARLLLAVLLLGNVTLLAVLLRDGVRLLRAPWVMALDLVLAAGLVLGAAATEVAGAILVPGGDGPWLYVICTVPLWLTVHGTRAGVAVLFGALILQLAALRLDGVEWNGSWLLLSGLHVFQVGLATLVVGLVMRMSRLGNARAHAESLRAGREAERVQVLTKLQRLVLEAWRRIAAPPERLEPEEGLDYVRRLAAATSAELRAVLRDERTTRPEAGLIAWMEEVATDVRRAGLPVEIVVTELNGEPPSAVVSALVTATGVCLRDLAARRPPGRVVVRITGSPQRIEVTVRDDLPRSSACPDAAVAMAAGGGSVEVRELPGRGTRTRLWWSAT